MRHVFLTAPVVIGLKWTIAQDLMMLECYALEALVLKEISDSREAPPPLDVWRSVIAMPGAQSVMTSGALLMLGLPVCNWDYQVHVILHSHLDGKWLLDVRSVYSGEKNKIL